MWRGLYLFIKDLPVFERFSLRSFDIVRYPLWPRKFNDDSRQWFLGCREGTSIKVKTASFLGGEFIECIKSRIFATNLWNIESILYEKDSIWDGVIGA